MRTTPSRKCPKRKEKLQQCKEKTPFPATMHKRTHKCSDKPQNTDKIQHKNNAPTPSAV